MNSLEILYETKHKNMQYFARKISINSKKTIINGVKKAGKTFLIIDYLQNFDDENVLYIDLKDERVENKKIAQNIHKFIKLNPIKILVIENYDFSFELPNVEEIILTCDKKIENYEILTLYPLDFEEFISFDKRHFNIEHLFNIYTNIGSYPQIVLNNSNNIYSAMQELLHVMIKDPIEFLIFKKFSEFQSSKISLFQIYNQLKTSIKISKDNLYKKVKKLESEKMLFLVEKYNSPKANKKLFLIDFALKNALTFKKEFLKRFENMVFLELMKKDYKIYYTDFIDLYIPQKDYGVFCIPFLTEDLIKIKLQKILLHVKELELKKIEIVTIGNEGEFWLKNIKCTILPYWDWALQD
ncbi:AAA family ATPase [Sulfurospirillum arcachonense]|uniref:AAA family ATPase n=1 Tax=Sulfurospirillum arcachonense TaxID=57666 RepID=UPI0004698DB0|nr:AAA family ATPase [Sulfurospirillum arcachonense]